MNKYKVRSGQNIFDVAVSLYGSVDGLFDLLASNPEITMDTTLHYGMELNYHEEFTMNGNITSWIRDNGVIVKNGEHVCRHIDLESYMEKFFRENHPNFDEYMAGMSADEQNMFWESQCTPKMIVKQAGILSTIRFELKEGKHMFIDWGDNTGIQDFSCAIAGHQEEVEHCYKGEGEHIITIYGDCEFAVLDLASLNGIYFPLENIYADRLVTNIEDNNLNKLIITI